MSTEVKVSQIPNCDICNQKGTTRKAYADAKLYIGPWANVCKLHFGQYRCSLGTGRGQKLVLETESQSQDERIRDNMRDADFDGMTYDEFEEMFEDRDPCEFL